MVEAQPLTELVMMRFTVVTVSILGLPLVAADPSQLKLFHRLFHPQAALVPFTERGIVTLADNTLPSFQPSSSFLDDFDSFADALQTAEKIPSGQWLYQVALQRHGDNVESQWDVSAVKAVSCRLNPSFDILIPDYQCHLPLATSETVYLHSLDASKPMPHALDYFISPVPHDGACPPQSSLLQSFPKKVNTTVVLRAASSPPVYVSVEKVRPDKN